MSQSQQGILDDGLFGGLSKELKLDFAALLMEVRTSWGILEAETIVDDTRWARGGAETYIATSHIQTYGGQVIRLLGKAFVRWGIPPVDQQTHWEARRKQFLAAGIPVPSLFFQYPAMSIEDFIPEAISGYGDLSESMGYQLGQIASRLLNLGLRPINILADVRVKSGTAYYVDLGSDLVRCQLDDPWVENLALTMPSGIASCFSHGASGILH